MIATEVAVTVICPAYLLTLCCFLKQETPIITFAIATPTEKYRVHITVT